MEKLFTVMSRLLGFSGVKLNVISKSSDGFIFDGEIDGEEVRVFITKPNSMLCYLDGYDYHELVNYEY